MLAFTNKQLTLCGTQILFAKFILARNNFVLQIYLKYYL